MTEAQYNARQERSAMTDRNTVGPALLNHLSDVYNFFIDRRFFGGMIIGAGAALVAVAVL